MADQFTNSISSRSTRSTSKKATKTTRGKFDTPKVVSLINREQMITEATYFKALNRDIQGNYCVEDWLEAETEIDTLLKDEFVIRYP